MSTFLLLLAGAYGLANAASPPARAASPFRVQRSRTAKVLMVGDSLSDQAKADFTSAVTATGHATVEQLVYGGTAVCDWTSRIQENLATWHPNALSIEFAGNAFTPCMTDPATGQPYSGSALVAKYMADLRQVLTLVQPTGAQVWIQSIPPMRDPALNATAVALNAGYQELAGDYTFVHDNDAGLALQWYQNPGQYRDYLPCLPVDTGDRCTNPPYTRVRAPDGVHFCPVAETAVNGVTGTCPVWSSGAWRYGTAMAQPIIDFVQRPAIRTWY